MDMNPLIEAAKERELNYFEIVEKGSLDINVIKEINRFIVQNNIEILHAHEVRSNLYGIVCAKLNKIKLVTTLHGWVGNSLKSKFLCELDKLLLHFFDLVIVVSEQMKKEVGKYGVKSSKVHLLRNSILIDQFTPDALDDSFRREYNISPETLLVAKIGRLSPEKGQSDLIKAARMVLKVEPNIKFLLIGVGPDENKLRDLCTSYNIMGTRPRGRR